MFTSGRIGDSYVVRCSSYDERDDKACFELSKRYHGSDTNLYIDTYEIKYYKIEFRDGNRFDSYEFDDYKTGRIKCRKYKIKKVRDNESNKIH